MFGAGVWKWGLVMVEASIPEQSNPPPDGPEHPPPPQT